MKRGPRGDAEPRFFDREPQEAPREKRPHGLTGRPGNNRGPNGTFRRTRLYERVDNLDGRTSDAKFKAGVIEALEEYAGDRISPPAELLIKEIASKALRLNRFDRATLTDADPTRPPPMHWLPLTNSLRCDLRALQRILDRAGPPHVEGLPEKCPADVETIGEAELATMDEAELARLYVQSLRGELAVERDAEDDEPLLPDPAELSRLSERRIARLYRKFRLSAGAALPETTWTRPEPTPCELRPAEVPEAEAPKPVVPEAPKPPPSHDAARAWRERDSLVRVSLGGLGTVLRCGIAR